MSKVVDFECQPRFQHHGIDRRDFQKDGNGNLVLVNGQKQLNWKCACGIMEWHAANYRGGTFEFLMSDDDVTKYNRRFAAPAPATTGEETTTGDETRRRR